MLFLANIYAMFLDYNNSARLDYKAGCEAGQRQDQIQTHFHAHPKCYMKGYARGEGRRHKQSDQEQSYPKIESFAERILSPEQHCRVTSDKHLEEAIQREYYKGYNQFDRFGCELRLPFDIDFI